MDDYISLREAQDAMTAENLIRNLDQVENGDANRYARAAIRVLEQLGPADVRPVVRGKWINAHPSSPIFDGGGPPYCSVCKKEVALRSVEIKKWKLERGHISDPEIVYTQRYFFSNFCPNCGAYMTGGTPTE